MLNEDLNNLIASISDNDPNGGRVLRTTSTFSMNNASNTTIRNDDLRSFLEAISEPSSEGGRVLKVIGGGIDYSLQVALGVLYLNSDKELTSSESFKFSDGVLTINSITNQIKISYDSSNYGSITSSAAGLITLDAAGSTAKFTFSKPVGIATSSFYASAKLAVGGVINQAFASRNITFGDGYIQWSSGNYSLWNATEEVLTISSNGGIGVNNNSPSASVILDLNSTTKALLVPRMTNTQRDAIATKLAGMIIFSTTDGKHQGYDGTTWNNFY